MPLFRPESFRTLDGLYGDVQQVPSVSWKIVCCFLLASLLVAAFFLSLGGHSSFAIVRGEIGEDDGVLHVSPARPGAVDRVLVQEGQSVLAGAPLARIRIAASDGTTPDDVDTRTLLVTAVSAGTVTDITVHPGDAATPGTQLLSIVPTRTRLEARLDVPPDAARVIKPGQPIRISVDGLPDRTFGTIETRLSSVSRTALPVAGSDGRSRNVFVASAPLTRDAISADGREQPLRPGMTVSARIETGKHSLASWLFDPILAVARR